MILNAKHTKKLIVKKGVDYSWLIQIADNQKTRDFLVEIKKWQTRVLSGENFIENKPFSLDLLGYYLWTRPSEAWVSIILFVEIFRENDHFLISEFRKFPTGTIVDLGANIGVYSLKAKSLNPTVNIIAVEPNIDAFELLKKNIESNNLQNVSLVKKAVASKNDTINFKTIHAGSPFGGKYLGEIKKESRKWIKPEMIHTITVETITLDTLLKPYNLRRIDILKLDVEGMELEVLQGGEYALSVTDKVVVEWHDFNIKRRFIDLMKDYGFRLLYDEPRDYGDGYFVKNSLLNL